MLNFGFYDSVDGDRTYNAESMSRLFDGIIRDGVFGTVGDHFALSLSPRGGLRVRVGSGRAWFNGTWTDLRPANSDDNLEFELTYNSSGSTRYDHIVLVVDKRATSRKNEIKVFEGSWPNDSTQWPTNVYYYRLGYVDVGSGVTALTYASIHTRVGFDNPDAGGVPFVTGPLETISIDDLVDEWEAEINDKIDAAIEEYFGGGTSIEFASVPTDIGNALGYCLTAGASLAKTVSVANYKRKLYGRVSVRFMYDVPANSTLDISSTGAAPIYLGLNPIRDGVIKAGMTVTFVYDTVQGGRYYVTAFDQISIDNIQFVHVSQNGSSFSTDTNADVIRAVLQNNPDVLVLMIDPDGRQGTMIKTPLNIGDSMKFAIVTDDGTMVYTITSGGTVSRTIDDNVYNVDNVVFVPFLLTGSGFEAQLTPEIIYNENVRDGKNILFCLVDPVTHVIAPLQNMLTSTSDTPIFRAVDTLNQQFVNYALSATGGVTWTTTSFGGSGDSVYPITVTISGSNVAVNRTIAEISAAKQAGKATPVLIDGTYCGWVGYADSVEVVINYYFGHDTLPTLGQIYMVGNTITTFYRILAEVPTIVTLSGASQTINVQHNYIYKCGELTSLTISNVPLTGDFTVIFTSGATPTTLSVSGLTMPDGFTVEANKRYEISVSDRYAVVASWAITS